MGTSEATYRTCVVDITVPAGALTPPSTIDIRDMVSWPAVSTYPPGLVLVPNMFFQLFVQTGGATQPLTMTFKPASVPQHAYVLYIAGLNDPLVEFVPNVSVNTSAGTVSFSARRGGAYVLVSDVGTQNEVKPLYLNGWNWNDHLANDGTVGMFDDWMRVTDAPCDEGQSSDARAIDCLHGGEFRSYETTIFSACAGLTITDELGAFDWVCAPVTGGIRAVSKGLKRNKSLRDLVDFSGMALRANRVTVTNGTMTAQSRSEVWWRNPVLPHAEGSATATWSIYTINAAGSGPYTLGGAKTALVTAPGVELTDGATPAQQVIFAAGLYKWIEAVVRGTQASASTAYNTYGIYLNDANHSVLRASAVSGFRVACVRITDGVANRVHNLTVTDCTVTNSAGLIISGAGHLVSDVVAANNYRGVSTSIFGDPGYATNSHFTSLMVSNSTATGVDGAGDFNTWDDVTVVGSDLYSMILGHSNVLQDATLALSVAAGLRLNSNALVARTLAFGNTDYGFDSTTGARLRWHDVAAAGNSRFEWGLNNSFTPTAGETDQSRFTGSIAYVKDPVFAGMGCRAGTQGSCLGPTTLHASISWGLISGGMPAYACVADNRSGNSPFTPLTSATGHSVMNGRPSTDTVHGSVSAVANTITNWTGFENRYRAFTKDAAWGCGMVGMCKGAATCSVFDFSASTTTDTTLRRTTLAAPDGTATLKHRWVQSQGGINCANVRGSIAVTGGCESTFLDRAVEVANDGVGNENGLCESNEVCVHTPNIMAWQGSGEPSTSVAFTNGTISNVKLLGY